MPKYNMEIKMRRVDYKADDLVWEQVWDHLLEDIIKGVLGEQGGDTSE